MANNKIVFGTNTLIDLTSDTVAADKMVSGYTAHNKAGEVITGTLLIMPAPLNWDDLETNNIRYWDIEHRYLTWDDFYNQGMTRRN